MHCDKTHQEAKNVHPTYPKPPSPTRPTLRERWGLGGVLHSRKRGCLSNIIAGSDVRLRFPSNFAHSVIERTRPFSEIMWLPHEPLGRGHFGSKPTVQPFHSQVWSISNFSCSLNRNITSNSMENSMAFHSFTQSKDDPILTTSLIQFR